MSKGMSEIISKGISKVQNKAQNKEQFMLDKDEYRDVYKRQGSSFIFVLHYGI